MKKLLNLVPLLVIVLTTLLAGAVEATEYANNTNPACRIARTNAAGAPVLQEPNHDDARAAMQKLGDAQLPFSDTPFVRKRHAEGLEALKKIDIEGTAALAKLAASTPHIDAVIDMHLNNLVWARSVLGAFYEDGILIARNPVAAVASYERAVDSSFTDDRGCLHSSPVSLITRIHLAGMYLYGIGTKPDPARAKALFGKADADTLPIIEAIDRKQLPGDYSTFVTLAANRMAPPGPTLEKIQTEKLQKAIYHSFGMDSDPVPSWIDYLFGGAVIAILVVIAIAAWREVRDKISVNGIPRTFFAAFDLMASAFARLDLFFKGLLSIFTGLIAFYSLSGSNLFVALSMPWINEWFNYAAGGVLLLVIIRGLFSLVEATRIAIAPRNTHAHGSARPASEAEARAAAIGNTKITNLHDHTFTD